MNNWVKKINKNENESNSEVSPNTNNLSDKKDSSLPINSHILEQQKRNFESQEQHEDSTSKKRKYNPTYLPRFGFVELGIEEYPKAKCVVCEKTFSNGSLVPSKLKKHVVSDHPHLLDNGTETFIRLAASLRDKGQMMKSHFKPANDKNKRATEASFIVSLQIAKAGKPHTIAEDFFKPCMIEVAKCLLGNQTSQHFEDLQLSNSTVSSRIKCIANSLENELIVRLKNSEFFAIQLDESTDVSGLAILLVFVRYPYEKRIEEELLLCNVLKKNSTGEEIFNSIFNYFNEKQIEWEKCLDICSDGGAAMIGTVKGAVSRIKKIAKNATSSHCIIHRHALATKRMPAELQSVLEEAVKMINYVKSRPLQSRLLKLTAEEMGMEHHQLLLHTEVRWLSRGKILIRLVEMREALKATFSDQNFIQQLSDVNWSLKLCYLADIFDSLNETMTSLQGKNRNFDQIDKIRVFKKHVAFFKDSVKKKDVTVFPRLNEVIRKRNINIKTESNADFLKTIISHLQDLETSIQDYFPDIDAPDMYFWLKDPFSVEPDQKTRVMSNEDFKDLLMIGQDSDLKIKNRELTREEFWMQIYSEKMHIGTLAIKKLLAFNTTYLCESAFSTNAYIKNKYRNKLAGSGDLRIKLSNIPVDVRKLTEDFSKQYHSTD